MRKSASNTKLHPNILCSRGVILANFKLGFIPIFWLYAKLTYGNEKENLPLMLTYCAGGFSSRLVEVVWSAVLELAAPTTAEPTDMPVVTTALVTAAVVLIAVPATETAAAPTAAAVETTPHALSARPEKKRRVLYNSREVVERMG